MTPLSAPQPPVATADISGQAVALHYSDPVSEYGALRAGALLLDRHHRQRMTLTGPRAGEALGGLVTNEVATLEPGHGCFAAALTAKGKIVADLRVFRTAEHFLVDTSARAAQGWLDTVRKYVNPRLAKHADISATTGDLGLFGVRAHHLLSEATGLGVAALGGMAPYAHVPAEIDGVALTIARVPDLVLEGYELFLPRAESERVWRRLAALGATPGGLTAWEIARVEAGRPEWGLDIDEGTLAQEANFDELHAISYTKGCYLGQETVARVHFRGHVNRHLRGLRLTSDTLPPPRAALFDEADKPVGDLRSAVLSPRLGMIALAMIRREVPLGAPLTVRWMDDGAREVTGSVLPLPFTV